MLRYNNINVHFEMSFLFISAKMTLIFWYVINSFCTNTSALILEIDHNYLTFFATWCILVLLLLVRFKLAKLEQPVHFILPATSDRKRTRERIKGTRFR